MENNGEDKKKSDGFYTYRGKKDSERPEPSPPEAVSPGPDAQEPAESLEATAEDAGQARAEKRVKAIAWALAGLLAAGAIIAVILNPGVLWPTGGQPAASGKPASTHKARPAWTGGTAAAQFLYSQPWDAKKHNSMQSLKKVKNLRYALQFFQNFTPEQAAAVAALPRSLADVAQNYEDAVGTFVDIDVKIAGTAEVPGELEQGVTGSPCLLSLPGDPAYGGASLLVLGPLDDVGEGDTVKCKCIPVYFYSPKDNPAGGGLLFVTIPQLVYKQK